MDPRKASSTCGYDVSAGAKNRALLSGRVKFFGSSGLIAISSVQVTRFIVPSHLWGFAPSLGRVEPETQIKVGTEHGGILIKARMVGLRNPFLIQWRISHPGYPLLPFGIPALSMWSHTFHFPAGIDIGRTRPYHLKSKIANGSAGVVWKAFDIRSRRLVAIKVFHPWRTFMGDADRVADVHRLLFSRSDSCIRFFARLVNRHSYPIDGFLVFELGGLSLEGILRSPAAARFSRVEVQDILTQLFRAVHYLHSLEVIHTDIKPANILLAMDRRTAGVQESVYESGLPRPSIKLVHLDDAVCGPGVRRHIVGTESYRAPEICAGLMWTEAVDVFSLGPPRVAFDSRSGE
ncbi:kinase-like domain-containing protein [Mycena galericulata]|nr:kinase-like domain-containing protein [Mycena galericulata]